MGKPTGFLEFERKVGKNESVKKRIEHYNEFHSLLSKEEQKIQGSRCMDCGIPFCQSGILLKGMVSGCPLNNLIPEFNDLVYRDNLDLALDRLLKTNPFPEFTGRVCPAPCESSCTLALNAPSVSIKENERYIIDKAMEEGRIKANPPKYRNDKKVAIIGSGPSGLSAAFYLNRYGYTVDVYEREDTAGGLLMYGIPNMKLGKNLVQNRVNLLKEEGITFYTNSDASKDESIKNKVLNEYDAVVLATGATKPRDLVVPGRKSKGVYFAVDYLKGSTKHVYNKTNEKDFVNAKNKNVLVIGGGDTGTDCIATAIRQGCSNVIQLEITDSLPIERLSNNQWPEWKRTLKVDYGQEEAIEVFGGDPRRYCSSVKEFIADTDGNLKEAKVVKVQWIKDETGRVTFKEVEGSEEIIKVDIALLAMGFIGTEETIKDTFNVAISDRGNIVAEYGDFKTNIKNIFSCGDARRGQSLVVWAIREGLEAAKAVNEYLVDK